MKPAAVATVPEDFAPRVVALDFEVFLVMSLKIKNGFSTLFLKEERMLCKSQVQELQLDPLSPHPTCEGDRKVLQLHRAQCHVFDFLRKTCRSEVCSSKKLKTHTLK